MKDQKPSATAVLILQSIVFLSEDPQRKHLVPEDSVKISKIFLENASFSKKLIIRAFKKRWMHKIFLTVEHLLLPGIMLHFVLRKRYIEEMAIQTITKGQVSQVVVIAAGFDTLAYRLSCKFPQVNFIEIDHPATQRSKKQILKEGGIKVATNFTFLAIDFSKEMLMDKILSVKQSDPALGVLFIAEGITMYLNELQIGELFAFVSKSASRGQFIFTFMERQIDGSIDFRHTNPLVRSWLDIKKEKMKWGLYEKDLQNFLKEKKFHFKGLVSHGILRSKYLTASCNLPLAEGECICLAESMNQSHIDVENG